MRKIILMSEYGFKLEDNPEKWISCDNKLLSSSMFKSLKVNDFVNEFRFNDKGFLISFNKITLAQHSEHGLEGESINSPLLNKDRSKLSCDSPSHDIKASDKDRQILKGQCLNIAFKDVDVTDSNGRSNGIRNAQKLFVELEEANFYRW